MLHRKQKRFQTDTDVLDVRVYDSGRVVVDDCCGWIGYDSISEAADILESTDPEVTKWLREQKETPQDREALRG